jgi:sugar lactone lactonase YvrE
VTHPLSAPGLRVLCHCGDILGEGPLWDHRAGRLLWIDILRGLVHSWSPIDGMRDLLNLDMLIGSLALAGEADLLLATSQGLMKWVASSGGVVFLTNPIAGRPVRFNDGRVDAAGRFWVGTMALDATRYADPLGELYRLDPDGSIHLMEAGLTISNGLDWSPDGRTFYLTDTMRRVIYAYDFDVVEGTITRRRHFVSTEEGHGFPDGLTVDHEGHLWSACFSGNGICRYDSDGRFIEKMSLPVSCPTAITFGGPNHSTAFITTSRHTLDRAHEEAEAGSLLQMMLPSRGRAAAVFGEVLDP